MANNCFEIKTVSLNWWASFTKFYIFEISTNKWMVILKIFKTHPAKGHMRTNVCFSLPSLISFKNIKVWIMIFHSSTPLEQNQDSLGEWIIGCLMLWRCFQCELNSLIMRIFTRFVHRNSKRRSYYILSMTSE